MQPYFAQIPPCRQLPQITGRDHGVHLKAEHTTVDVGCHENSLMISVCMKTALKGFNFEIAAGKNFAEEHTLQLISFKQLCVFITYPVIKSWE